MKRYISGVIAVLIAVAAFAFTKPENKVKPSTTYTFFYNSSSYLQPDVQDRQKWLIGTGSGCSGLQNKACQMEVTDSYTHIDPDSGDRVLNTSGATEVVIAAVKGADNVNYVPNPATSTGIQSASDKP